MIHRNTLYLLGFLLLLPVVSCSDRKSSNETPIDEHQLREPLIKANKHLAASEEDMINDFIARYNWTMEVSGNGLRYMVYEQGSGPQVSKGDRVILNYELRLLNGEMIYSSEESGPKIFRQGKAEVEKGLDEAVLILRQGDRAKLILPSHLGFGLIGDQDRIPPKAVLIYDIHVSQIEK